MKQIFVYFIVAGFLISCEEKPKTNNSHYSSTIGLILDITDPRTYWPDADQILQLYHCKQTPDAECIFRLRTISDKRLSPIVTYRLADAESMEKENDGNDPQFRNKNIIAFYNTVRKAITDFYDKTDTAQSLSHSECYRVIADELTFLAETKSDQCVLICASDLMEKSDLMNCYTTDLDDPKQIATQLDAANLLPNNLQGINIIFLFNPRNPIEDKNFALMIEAYKMLLQPKGVEIKTLANL